MSGEILSLFGGVGLFLFGMQTMTGALRRLAGRRTRQILARFTRTPLSGVVAGAATTAAIQSSSATVMTVIGFVGAGLLTFPQAIGVVFGANIGTTATGWMVAILGLKFRLGMAALPLLLAGSLLAMRGEGRGAQAGLVLSGFSLVFIGLDLMQAGMATVEPLLGPALPAADGFGGRLALVAVGAVVTAIVQSSSAAVAATLVLLSGGTIGLLQAAALVIGMDIGTTFKSLVATIGGARDMRRTALAHVGYNLVTASLAFFLVGLVPLLDRAVAGDATMALVAFHTLFNLTGVLLMLPLIRPFARLIERMVPGASGPLPEPPDRKLLADPDAALDAAGTAAAGIASAVFTALAARLRGTGRGLDDPAFRLALEDLEDFAAHVAIEPEAPRQKTRYAALLHLVDHLNRLLHRAGQDARMKPLRRERSLIRPARALAAALERASRSPGDSALAERMARVHLLIAGRTARLRRSVLLREHVGLVAPADVFLLTDSLRWLERSLHHAERIVHHASVLTRVVPDRAPVADTAEPG